MKTQNLFLLCLLVTFVIACENENEIYNEPFQIGVISQNSVYKKYDPHLIINASLVDISNSSRYESDTIDVDNDGLKDFIFTSHTSKDLGLWKRSLISIYNSNFEILYSSSEQVVKQIKYSLEDAEYTFIGNLDTDFNPSVEVSIDTFYNWGNTSPRIFKANESIQELDKWQNDFCVFSHRDSTNYRVDPGLNFFITNLTQSGWNSFDARYLVFRLNKNGLKYYGWLKINIDDFCRIEVFESYFQKNGFEE